MEKQPVFTKAHIGCFFDSQRGIYMGEAIIDLAIQHGFIAENETELDLTTQGIFYLEITKDAENYLQALCDDDVYFSTEHADFCLIEVGDPNYPEI